MKIYDCFTYFDEDLILDARLNILDKYIDKFIICEATFTHSGRKKKLNFNIEKFSKFKDKIIYIPLKDQPNNLRVIKNDDNQIVRNSKILDNALLRENFQKLILRFYLR